MGQAQAIRFQVSGLDQQFSQLYPRDFGQALRINGQVIGARARLDASMDAFRQTMTVQSQVVENVSADAHTLSDIVSRSQGAGASAQPQQAKIGSASWRERVCRSVTNSGVAGSLKNKQKAK